VARATAFTLLVASVVDYVAGLEGRDTELTEPISTEPSGNRTRVRFPDGTLVEVVDSRPLPDEWTPAPSSSTSLDEGEVTTVDHRRRTARHLPQLVPVVVAVGVVVGPPGIVVVPRRTRSVVPDRLDHLGQSRAVDGRAELARAELADTLASRGSDEPVGRSHRVDAEGAAVGVVLVEPHVGPAAAEDPPRQAELVEVDRPR
jgi:hypothetical protein